MLQVGNSFIIKKDKKADISIKENEKLNTNKGEYIFSLEKAKINDKGVDKYALYESEEENIELQGKFIYIRLHQ